MEARAGEASKSWFRSERFYHTGDGWWFLTRENAEFGPFISQKDAEQELCLYIRNLQIYQGMFDQDGSNAQKLNAND